MSIKLTLNNKAPTIRLKISSKQASLVPSGSNTTATSASGVTFRDDESEEDDRQKDQDYVDNEDDDDAQFFDGKSRGSTKRKRASTAKPRAPAKRATGTDGKLSSSTLSSKLSVNSTDRARSSGASGKVNPLADELVVFRDFSKTLSLKPDHAQRPLWITANNLIYVEKFSPIYTQAADFLVAIAEPESRPEYIQTYKITPDSLYSAVAVAIDAESIVKVLDRLCKTNLPEELVNFIHETTKPFGKAKIVLKNNRYYIESKYPEILNELLRHPTISAARETNIDGVDGFTTDDGFVQSEGLLENAKNLDYATLARERLDFEDEDEQLEGETRDLELDQLFGLHQKRFQTVSFMIFRLSVQDVKKCAKRDVGYPLMEEYDFKKDRKNPNLEIDLRPSTKIRPYQEKSLSKMFGNGRARSGIIVLPCGAGKSLTGVTAATTVKKSCVVMCINNASVRQWKEQFTNWTNVAESSVRMFTRDCKDPLPPAEQACIVITTYSMLCHSGRRSSSAQLMINAIEAREWGLLILDEVHVAPAEMFQKVVDKVNAHCKLGLTATLVREDNKIPELGFLVGPKLYEANWIDLTNQGFLAKVQCAEIWCPMTKEFFREYVRFTSYTGGDRMQKMLYTLNPAKFRACEYLVNYHMNEGHKIIIFSDDVPALVLYCELLGNVPYIYGGTKEDDRTGILTAFKTSRDVPCIGLSKVGDTALDIPEANVVIQVSSHFGARRQEAQRLGRILRPKPNPTGGFNAFFYTLVSTDTKDMFFSTKRQQYLVDQGYTFKVVQDLSPKADAASKRLNSKQLEMNLLEKVLDNETIQKMIDFDKSEDKAINALTEGEVEDAIVDEGGVSIKRTKGRMGAISGGAGLLYAET